MALHTHQQPDVDDLPPPGLSLTQLPSYCLWTAWGFLLGWIQTRRVKPLLLGIPVIGLGFTLSVLFVAAEKPVGQDTINGYLERARVATAEEEFEEADFYLRKLDHLAPNNREVIRERAIWNEKQGNYREAFQMMESLARDEDRTNDADVHLWLAQTALKPEVQLDNKLDYVKVHLNGVLEERPDDRFAQFFFTQLYLRQGDLASAIAHLEHIEQYSEELQLYLASLYQAQGDAARTKQHAQTAVDTLANKIRTTQTADVKVYHQLAAGQLMLREFAKAESTLLQALTKFNQEATRRQLAQVYVRWSDDVVRKDTEDFGDRMRLLEKALVTAPNEPLVLYRMVDLASAEGPVAEAAEERLRQALAEGIAPASIHFSLGALAAKRGDTEAAMRHFRLSEQLNPKTAVTMNNIAYLMAQAQDADLDQALEMIDQALQMAPNAAPFRETRGQILVRMGRWSEAIADLEFANSKLTQPSHRIGINRSLAKAYEGLGDTKTAESYREKAKELAAEVEESSPEDALSVPVPNPSSPLSDGNDAAPSTELP